MKAIILAAGKGSRISEKIGGVPKSVLPLSDGTPIIRRSVRNIISQGIEPIVCVGYRKEEIYKALEGLTVQYYENPFYSVMNNIVSLWFARNEFSNDDILLSSADLFYPDIFLDMMSCSNGSLAMAVDSSRIENGDFYFSVKNGIIEEHGPQVDLDKRNFEYMGLTVIRKEIVQTFKGYIDSHIEKEMFSSYFEDVIIAMHVDKNIPIDFIDMRGNYWKEFDFYEDYEDILKYERNSI